MLEFKPRQRDVLIDRKADLAIEAGIYIILGGIFLFATAVTAWDFIAERVNRKAHKH